MCDGAVVTLSTTARAGLVGLAAADAPLNLEGAAPDVRRQVRQRLLSPDFDAWSATAARVGYCARPVRLQGSSTRVDAATGEVVSSYSSSDEPLGLTYVRCGNRRASECPSCSRIYAADTFHLIRAGVTGGKTVPPHVSANPLVFATLTAPSFGHVHGERGGRRCRPRDKATRCEHGKPVGCMKRHCEGDRLVGEPLCADCYDYATHVVWQWWAPELWRRFTVTLRRLLAHRIGVPESRLPDLATVQYAKVAEYQRRGVIHFHALVRLDGPKTPDGFTPAPTGFDADGLADLVRDAAASVTYTAPALSVGDVERVLRFGAQVDARAVSARRRPDTQGEEGLSAEQVSGYLAKYATKSASDTTGEHTDSAHLRRIHHQVGNLADAADPNGAYGLLGRWGHMLGFRGHFSSKSRRYSITLSRLRRARRRFQTLTAEATRNGQPLDTRDLEARLLAEDDDTTLIVGSWSFAGTGWNTEGDTALALAAAARAREHHQSRAERRHRNWPCRRMI